MSTTIAIKRIYEPPARADGYRVLIDRLWPRGIKKESAAIDEWAKDIAPSSGLRKYFSHDPEHWPAFQKEYKEELKANEAVKEFVKTHKKKKKITLLYASKNEEYNHAIVLKAFLTPRFKTV